MPNVETLTQALRVLRAVPEDRLHMNVVAEIATCGTACCLAGWICLDPWFREHTEVGTIPLDEDGLPPALDTLEKVGRVLGLNPANTDRLLAGRGGMLHDPHAIKPEEVEDNLLRLLDGQVAQTYWAIDEAEEDIDDEWDEDQDEDD